MLVLITFALTSLGAAYPLDGISRDVPKRGKLSCDRSVLERYAGELIPYRKVALIHPAFKDRLTRFEAIVTSVALEVYGRAPKQIVHLGTYNCRRIRSTPHLLSEHALGNAIDVAGFDFDALPEGSVVPEGLSKRHQRRFKVRMKTHWNAKGRDQRHAHFLRTLAVRMSASNVFRVLLGPAWPGHDDHFHFDMAPYHLVKIFD